MLTLYYFPNLASLATHLTLEEIGAPYECKLVDIMKGEHKQPDYLAKNPAGQVPTLQIDENTYLTETVAILDYLATTFPEANLAPGDAVGRARWIAAMARIASAMHPTFTRVVRPAMIVDDEQAHAPVSATARTRYAQHLGELDALIGDNDWLLGSQLTTADMHALVVYNWAVRANFPVQDFKNLTRWKDRMIARPAVRAVLENEGSTLVEAA